MSQQVHTVASAARALRKRRSTVEQWIRQGILKASRLPDGSLRIPDSAIDEFLAEHEVKPAVTPRTLKGVKRFF